MLSNIGKFLPPLSSLLAENQTADEVRDATNVRFPNNGWNRNARWLADQDDGNDKPLFYDLYLSPCRGILHASNDELLDYVDLDEMDDDITRNNIFSYNNGDGNQNKDNALYEAFYYYYDDIEYCGATFYGGCQFSDLEDLEAAISDMSSSSAVDALSSDVNFTIMYDYEIHYIDNSSGAKRTEGTNGVDGKEKPLSTSLTISEGGSNETKHSKLGRPEPTQRGDPIPAVKHLETIVLEHLGEVLGLTRHGCDLDDSSSSNMRRNYQHDFSDEDLSRIVAISSEPKDTLDPYHINCIVPVAVATAETTDCIPVSGGIRIYLNTTGIVDDVSNDESVSLADLELSIRGGFQRLIRFGMQQNLYTSVSDEDGDGDEEVIVKNVSFIGTRVASGDNRNSVDDDIVDDAILKVDVKEELSTINAKYSNDDFTSSNETHTIADNPDIDGSPSPNSLKIDTIEKDFSEGNIAIVVVVVLGIIFVSALFASRVIKVKANRIDDNIDTHLPAVAGSEVGTPRDIERQPVTFGAVIAENPAGDGDCNDFKASGSGQSVLSESTIEDEVYEDGDEDDGNDDH